MILIFSTVDDSSTQQVIDWLYYYKQTPVVINEINPIVDLQVTITQEKQISLIFNLKDGKEIDMSDIGKVWYRRGDAFLAYNFDKLSKKKYLKPFFHNLKEEYKTLQTFIFSILKPKTIGDFENASTNKLKVLDAASHVGLLIPQTRIVSDTKYLTTNEELINKNIQDIVAANVNNVVYYNRTTPYIQNKYQKVFPSLLQTEIKKKYEIRIFYISGLFYCMAIFSQGNDFTKTDFRDITQKTILRKVPFEMPKKQISLLKKLISFLDYTSCSIDMIVDVNNRYYFLEINPVGQFGMVSQPCNYNIEKEIALKLINND